jgi:hypothetical protein
MRAEQDAGDQEQRDIWHPDELREECRERADGKYQSAGEQGVLGD